MGPLVTLQNARPVLVGIYLLATACGTQPLPGALTQPEYLQQGIEIRTHNKGTAPHLGLALAGGGIKAGNFAIGVLQGLTEAKVMGHVDAVSSVSGGGYAALWYYSRLLNPGEFTLNLSQQVNQQEFAERFFTDCIPQKYLYFKFINRSRYHQNTSSGDCPMSKSNFVTEGRDFKELAKEGFKNDEVRYQNHLRGYQDVFSLTNSFSYRETTMDKWPVGLDYGLGAALTLGATVFNIVPNIIFDWEIPLSTSRWQYERGIIRTFGATPTNCTSDVACTRDFRPAGTDTFVRQGLTFDLLRQKYEQGMVPLWIINTTAGENRDFISAWFKPRQKPFQLTSFEFSPYGSGSGLFGYSSQSLSNLLPWQAVVSSAAFLDSQQKVETPKLNPLLNFFTLDWGRSLPNPRVHLWKAAFHKLLPFPLYLGHGRSGNFAGDYVNIRLSDGGQSENLGAHALIERNFPNMIISDHAFDRSGRMEDVCRLRDGLIKDRGKNKPLYLYFPGLNRLDEVCAKDSNLGYDIFNWEHPVLLGCVTSDRGNRNCIGEVFTGEQFQRVYLIKPSLPNLKSGHYLGKKFAETATVCNKSRTAPECTDAVKKACNVLKAGSAYQQTTTPISQSSPEWKHEEYLSCELLAFILIDAWTDPGYDRTDGCPYAPQGSTRWMTLDSSPFLFGVYRELGRYYARQLGWFWGNLDNGQPINAQLMEDRFRRGISYQKQYSFDPQLISTEDKKAGEIGHCLK